MLYEPQHTCVFIILSCNCRFVPLNDVSISFSEGGDGCKVCSQWDFNIIIYGIHHHHHHHELRSWPAVLVVFLLYAFWTCLACSRAVYMNGTSILLFFWGGGGRLLPINPALVLVVVGKGIAEYCRQLVLIPASSPGGYGFQTLPRA